MRRTISALACAILTLAASALFAQGDGWDLQFSAGSPNHEDGLRFIPMTPIDGAAKLVEKAGRYCLTTDYGFNNGYIYFDAGRKRMLEKGGAPYVVEVAIDYLDQGTDAVALQYDSVGTAVEQNFREKSWKKTGTGEWKRVVLRLEDAEFRNAQMGSADFRIAAGPDGDEFISGVSVRIISGAPGGEPIHKMRPERQLPAKKWTVTPMQSVTLVTPSGLSGAERIALDRLTERMRYLGAPAPRVTHSLPRSIVAGQTCVLLGVAKKNADVARFPGAGTLIAGMNRKPVGGQAYALATRSVGTGGRLVLAVGAGPMGSVFAISHLQTHLWYDSGALNLHLDSESAVEAPSFRDRELYINVGYGLSRERMTTETWTLQEWKDYIDKLVLARYNSWSFYIWGDSELAYPGSKVNAEMNVRVHKTIQQAIDYSHKRGLKVGFHITCTLVPVDIWEKRPELHSRLEYPWTGIICPSKKDSWPIMEDVYRNEIRWFKACDFHSIWFYDAGGCFCDTCKVADNQLAAITREVKMLTGLIRKANPSARIQVMTWGIWRYERMHHYNIRDRFVRGMSDFFGKDRSRVTLADGIYIDPGSKPLFPEIRKYKFDAKSFLYQTNIEDGQPFAILQTRYFEQWTPESLKVKATGIFPMRIEAGSKYPDDFVGGSVFWDASSKGIDAIRTYANYVTGDSEAGAKLGQALVDMDDFAWFGFLGGGADAARGARISSLISEAIAPLPGNRRSDLSWLAATGEAYRVIGKGIEAKDMEDTESMDALTEEFNRAIGASPLFHYQSTSKAWRRFYKEVYVNEFYNGWSSTHF